MPRVLLVDDHAFTHRGIQTILNPFPQWKLCGEADNGKDAIRMASELEPEVIIMDVSMTELNGIEATRAIRRAQSGIKIILLTLHESAELVRSAFRAGARVSFEDRCGARTGEGSQRGHRRGCIDQSEGGRRSDEGRDQRNEWSPVIS